MRPSEALNQHRDALRALAERHRVRNLRVFDSVAGGEDTEASDLDLLADPMDRTSLIDIVRFQRDAVSVTGFSVDLVLTSELPEHHRQRILDQARFV